MAQPSAHATIFQNTFQGDLVKSAFIEWLNSNGISQIWEYDRQRTDGFRGWNRLGYQFRVTKGNGDEVKIDVNSSVPTRGESNEVIVRERDIKITAGKRRGQRARDIQLVYTVKVLWLASVS